MASLSLIIPMVLMRCLMKMLSRLLLVACGMSLVACRAYLYTEVRNDTPLPCQITCGNCSFVLEPGETELCPVYSPGQHMPVLLTQGADNQLVVSDCQAFRAMAQKERGHLWLTLYVIPYIRETLVLCHDESGRLTWKKK